MTTRTRAKKKPEPTPTALQVEEQIFGEIKNAQLASGENQRATAEADAEIIAAKQELEDALDDVVRGAENADERHSAAVTRQFEAQDRRARLDPQRESCARVIRSSQERLRQLRETNLDEFRDEAETYVAEYEAAVAEALPALQAVLSKWERAQARYNSLGPAIRVRVLENDRASGWDRADSRVSRDCRVPDCPIDVSILNELVNVSPRPPAMASDYTGDPFAPAEMNVSPPPPTVNGVEIYFENKIG